MSKKQLNMKSKKWIILMGAVLILTIAAYFSTSKKNTATGSAAAQNSKTAKVEQGSIEVVKEGNGTVEVKDSQQVTVIYDSKILSIEKENGDYVEEGDILALVDSSGLDDSISQLENEISDLGTQISNKDSSGDS